jgi:hypothetical protein
VSGKRYAWEAVESLRRGHKTAAEGALATAQRELAQAEGELERVELLLRAEREAGHAASLLAMSESSGLELQRAAAYAARRESEHRELLAVRARAARCVSERRDALERAKHALAEAHGQERVIERDRERWQGEQRREREQRESHEVEERAATDRKGRGLGG